MEITRTARGFRAVDDATNTVDVQVTGWRDGGAPPAVDTALAAATTGPDEVETVIEGTVETLTFPPVFLRATATETGESWEFGESDEHLRLPSRSHLLRVDSTVRVFVRFDGPADIHTRDNESISLAFSEPTPVSLCFDSLVETPDTEVTVPETPAGVATALTLASATSPVTSPDRSWPTCREQPPAITVGGARSLPSSLVEDRPETGVELVVPPDLRYLLTGASLAYYLAATVRTESGAEPRLRFGDHEEPLGELPAFERRTASLLRRVFCLDCVARGGGSHGSKLGVTDTFDTLGLDAERLYGAPVVERLRTYLDVPFERVADAFPPWHLGLSISPTYDHVETLPHLLADVPQLSLPRSSSLTKDEWLRVSVADQFPETPAATADDGVSSYRVRREVAGVELVDPELGPARTHGWMSDDVPVDAFVTLPEAYENRVRYLDDPESSLSVVAVVVDRDRASLAADGGGEDTQPRPAAPDGETRSAASSNTETDDDTEPMRAEHRRAVEHYEQRAAELPIDIRIEENVKRGELAQIFAERHDLVHYIGHRDERGLECANGYLDVSTVEESNAQTFFLNACGSYPEGEALVRKGSVGGGVTLERVGDEQAATVGTTFARLLMHGFCLERALTLARRQLMTAKDYVVVGDGTHVVTQSDAIIPPVAWVFDDGDEDYRVQVRHGAPGQVGGRVKGHLDDHYHLWGVDRVYDVTTSELREYLDTLDSPVVYDRQLYWPETFATTI
jgi:hypothetical protein